MSEKLKHLAGVTEEIIIGSSFEMDRHWTGTGPALDAFDFKKWASFI